MPTCLIVGASRGIGLEMARQYAADGFRVLATCRQEKDRAALEPVCARVLRADVRDAGDLEALAAAVADDAAGGLDLAIIVAGVSGPRSVGLVAPDGESFDQVMHTNVLTAMRLIPALAPSLAAAGGKLVVLSSLMGSIGKTSDPSWWLYRASKAALNSVLKSASAELGARGVVCMSVHPGWVRTDMGGAGATLDVAQSVSALRKVISAANRSHNGRFLNYNGEQLEW